MFPKPQRWRSKKWRDAARGQNCTLRLPGCRNDRETVVLAHRNGAGVGMKSDDHDAADMCGYCHDIYDGRKLIFDRNTKYLSFESHVYVDVAEKTIGGLTMEQHFERARLETIVNRLERGVLK